MSILKENAPKLARERFSKVAKYYPRHNLVSTVLCLLRRPELKHFQNGLGGRSQRYPLRGRLGRAIESAYQFHRLW